MPSCRSVASSLGGDSPRRLELQLMVDFCDDFDCHMASFRTPPILFVGAGLSRRYLGLDDWTGLLMHVARLTDRSFQYYLASADGDLPTVATLIAERLHESWWSEARFADARTRHERELHTAESACKAAVSDYIASKVTVSTDAGLVRELDLLANVVVDGIVTTNYDALVEQMFPD
jgi:hypothetical protein